MSDKLKLTLRIKNGLAFYIAMMIFCGGLLASQAEAVNLVITKTVDNSTPSVGDTVTFTIRIENREEYVESAGAVFTDNMEQFENVQFRYRIGYWAGWLWTYYAYTSYTPWENWTGSMVLDELDRWKWWRGKGGRYEFEFRVIIPESLSGHEVTNTATITKGSFSRSSSTSIVVQEEPWTGGEVFTPYLKSLPDLYEPDIQPNVLLLIDTSGSMTFDMKNDSTTYGDGSKPVTYGFNEPQFYYGRDTDSTNNNPDGEHNYMRGLKYIPQSEIDLIVDERGNGALSWLGQPLPGDDPPAGYSSYKYPNDSRMYQTKLVLNEIFSDPQLISGLRVALATYDQDYSNYGSTSDWYSFYSYYYEKLHYTTGGTKAKLREDFGSVDNSSHLSAIVHWFDGVEEEGNPELRAQGFTPLAASIYGINRRSYSWNWDPNVDSAVKFFEAPGAIQAWCQKNYLIVLTDGADTAVGDPAEAVKKLYEEVVTSRWPEFFGRKAEPVKTLVIGFIDPDADGMADLVETLNEMADYGWDGVIGNADPSDDPFEDGDPEAYFAKNLDELLAAFREIFGIIQAGQSTGGAPMVSPARTSGETSSVYVASFLPQDFSQWKGHFYRYDLTEEGIESDPVWDAAEVLMEDGMGPDNRTICTVNWIDSGGSKPSEFGNESNFVEVTSDGASFLSVEMAPDGYNIPSVFFSKLVAWIKGYDAWDEDPGSDWRYMFSDVYHGGVTEVGSPVANYPSQSYMEFKENHEDREKLLYIQSNAGMLHAIKVEDGKEKWAFIPPNVLAKGRLLGLKAYFGSGSSVTLLDDTLSVPRYLLDGPVVAEDVMLSETWRTVLVGCLGYGGQGIYALDITDPDDPVFLWAVENNIFSADGSSILPEDSRRIHYWKWEEESNPDIAYSSVLHGDVEEDGELDYRQLYRTLSTPVVAYAKAVVQNDEGFWQGRWIAALGNGHPGSDFTDDLTEGYVYFINIENGEILKKLTALDGRGNNILKPVTAPICAFSSSIASSVMDYIYAADIDGNIFSWSAYRDHWGEASQIFYAPEDEAGVTYRLDVGMIDGDLWLFWQTGDMENLNFTSDAFNLYAINTAAAEEDPIIVSDLQHITPTSGTSSSNVGWYMTFDDDPLETPTTPVVFYNGYLLFATFVKDPDPCVFGNSKIYIVNASTGEGAWDNNAKYVQLSGVQITGVTIFDDRMYLGIVGFTTEQDVKDVLGQSADLTGNLLSFDLPGEVPSNGASGPVGDPGLIFWKEWRGQ